MAHSETNQLFDQTYHELRGIAQAQIGPLDTLNTTALVHELYMRMSARAGLSFADKRSFFAYAARAMRHLLVDRARARLRLRRGSGAPTLDLEDHQDASVLVQVDDSLEIDELLRRLSLEDERAAQVLELHYFGGLTCDQIAETLALNRRTILRDLEFARLYIRANWNGVRA